MRTRLIVAALVVSLTPCAVRADHPLHTPPQHTHERAGWPLCVAWYAKPGRTEKYTVGYLGGGCLSFKSEGRCATDGIFGWDYVGCGWYPGRIFLNWCHGHKLPPAGPYKTDGPHVPDIFALHPLQRLLEKKEGRGSGH